MIDSVIPAKAGIEDLKLDSCFRRNDKKALSLLYKCSRVAANWICGQRSIVKDKFTEEGAK